ncbi:HDOD domain-containing protein [Thermosulfurimonas sp. F29]|uniref:HDOD domain-containing protein n=1 Tax=Thermosulfurimonas sp. F29 TaxID=2867247 RepID=UPI001C83751F|nr:HDOD domain-containing protein [Thermosulfurimonas sp. F29]MBX6422294.1 HDOD domain-containing protein [Thermosulfurimonas sp. F29]
MLDDKRREVKKKLRTLEGLPTLPPIVAKLTRMIGDETVSAPQIAAVIEKDQVLTSKVLRLVNSAFYGFPRRISTVSNAIVLLGFNVIRTLVITASIFEMMQSRDVGLWEHSLGVAMVSGLLARRLGLDQPEEVATAGLLHDLGKVVERATLLEEYRNIQQMVNEREIPWREAEAEILHMDHAEMGGYLLNRWNLPERLIEPVSFHHEVHRARNFPVETAVVQMADLLVRARGFGFAGDPWVPEPEEKTLKLVPLSREDLSALWPELEVRFYELRFFTEEIREALSAKSAST